MFDFSYFPVLETAHFRLRQITSADADAIIGLFGNPEVMRYSNSPPILTNEAAVEFINWLEGHFQHRAALRWGITFRGDDRVIGTCGFHFWDAENRHTDIGYDLLPEYWGKGYMTEIVRVLVGWCFQNLNLHRIQADCTAGNIGSERVLEKVGFTLEGIWRERDWEHGRFVDIKQFGLLRREFLPPGS
ncbi:MAG: GNAT family N-acetyltransferase [Chloroflexi bacterium]|nr:GNAT family N-acetyltransferase [Chloroflexota bacterium]